jgi:chaperonin GroES
MPKHFIEPATDHVVVVDLPRETVINDIEMPDNVKQQDMVAGLVVFVGPACTPLTKAEDQVLYGPYAGKNIVIEGQEFRILREGQIELYLRKSN